jgi:D-tyrosyl-tRNA(Tyr) deacylase
MRALIQRVSQARVDIAGETVGEVGNGMLVLVCAMQGDGDDEARILARKTANLRIFESEPGKMNLSVVASGGGALVVSQFTLAADTSRGNRPGFSYAAPPDEGERLYELFTVSLAEHEVPVATGRFGQEMQVHLVNDGPVTIWLDTAG